MGAIAAALTVLIMFGVTARLTRLITEDTIAEPVRAAVRLIVIKRRGPRSIWLDWVRCPWCVGLYLAVAVALAMWGAERLLLDDPLLPLPGWLWVPGLALTNNYLAARWQT
jgi:hypothetical protein